MTGGATRAAALVVGLGLAGCAGPRASDLTTLPAPASTVPPAEVTVAPARPPAPARRAPSAGKGALRFKCDPPDAEVVVDGVTQGIASDFAAPEFLELDPGPHRIELRKSGFSTFRTEVYVSEEVTETIPVTLKPLPARAAAAFEGSNA